MILTKPLRARVSNSLCAPVHVCPRATSSVEANQPRESVHVRRASRSRRRGESCERRAVVFVRVLGVDRLAGGERRPRSRRSRTVCASRLTRCISIAAPVLVVERAVAELVRGRSSPPSSRLIRAQEVEVERRRDAERVVVGGLEHALGFSQVGAEEEEHRRSERTSRRSRSSVAASSGSGCRCVEPRKRTTFRTSSRTTPASACDGCLKSPQTAVTRRCSYSSGGRRRVFSSSSPSTSTGTYSSSGWRAQHRVEEDARLLRRAAPELHEADRRAELLAMSAACVVRISVSQRVG